MSYDEQLLTLRRAVTHAMEAKRLKQQAQETSQSISAFAGI